jgi:hypothetical protein
VRDLVLHGEDVGEIPVVTVRPARGQRFRLSSGRTAIEGQPGRAVPGESTGPAKLRAIRSASRLSCGMAWLRSSMPRWISTAHLTASTTLANSTSRPSPVGLTIRPACLVTAGSIQLAQVRRQRGQGTVLVGAHEP